MKSFTQILLLGICVVLLAVGCSRSAKGASDARAGRHISGWGPDASTGSSRLVVSLEQGWTDKDAQWFYNVPQGSLLVPYEWFLHLEQASSEKLFRSTSNIRRFGYISRDPSEDNLDGLPIGFTKDDGTKRKWLGMSCAACHTNEIHYDNVAYLIDGAPTLADAEGFLRALVEALETTAADTKSATFERFASRVLGSDPSDADKDRLAVEVREVLTLRRAYNDRNLSREPKMAFGHGRYDAFGAILNELSVRFLESEGNKKLSDAPVSYPFLWDTPQHDRVQWNGVAANKVIGTSLGALARNAGEVLGVFGDIDIKGPGTVGYASSIRISNLRKIEKRVSKLMSPLWPDSFPGIDTDMADEGRKHFAIYCGTCHDPDFDRKSSTRKIKAVVMDVGTDPVMARNFEERTVSTGDLDGVHVNFFPLGKKFGGEAQAADVLIHTAVGAILGGWKEAPADTLAKIRWHHTDKMHEDFIVGKPPAKYKARPLNGIWATAPYLHNGSVPNLRDLLIPAANRTEVFWVGRRDFDPNTVGFVATVGESLFRFDTGIRGNSNRGHEYGTGVSKSEGGDGRKKLEPEQINALLEYMKSL